MQSSEDGTGNIFDVNQTLLNGLALKCRFEAAANRYAQIDTSASRMTPITEDSVGLEISFSHQQHV